MNGLFSHSTLKAAKFNQLKTALNIDAPALQSHNTTRFLSRYGASLSVVKNYSPLLKFSRAEGGRVLQQKERELHEVGVQAVQTRLAAIQSECGVVRQRMDATRANVDAVAIMVGQNPSPAQQQQYSAWYAHTLAGEVVGVAGTVHYL